MTLTTRFAAGFLALSLGVSAPLMASATPQDASEQPQGCDMDQREAEGLHPTAAV